MKTKISFFLLVILFSQIYLSAQQYVYRSVIYGKDTGVICNSTDPDKYLGKMVLNSDDYSLVKDDKQNGAIICTIAFTDSENGWAIGTMENYSTSCAVIYRSTNGGQSWKLQYRSGTNLRITYFGFNDAETGCAHGIRTIGNKSFDTTLVTQDGGQTWLEGENHSALTNSQSIAYHTEP